MKIDDHISDSAVLAELGKRIADYRIHIPMTQSEMSDVTGLSVHTITNAENGKSISTENFVKILYALGLQGNIDILIPAVEQRPSELYERGKPRVRATSPKHRKTNSGFKWGDEI